MGDDIVEIDGCLDGWEVCEEPQPLLQGCGG
jgi:hypothetical protein